MNWATVAVSTFIVSLTVFIVASNNDTAGWIYVLILLLSISLLAPNFSKELGYFGPPPISGGSGGNYLVP